MWDFRRRQSKTFSSCIYVLIAGLPLSLSQKQDRDNEAALCCALTVTRVREMSSGSHLLRALIRTQCWHAIRTSTKKSMPPKEDLVVEYSRLHT